MNRNKTPDRSPATYPPGTNKHPNMSVAEIAKKLDISKNEVRRRKVAGRI